VVLADVNEPLGAVLAKELGAAARFARTDVTDAASAQAAIDLAVSAFGGLNGVINCAGIAWGMRVLGKEGPHDLAAFARVLNINVVGTFNVLRLAAAAMSQAQPDEDGERGVIINTSSCAAFEGQIGQAAYSASKAAVAGMTLPLARELARFGIRVMAIAPGTFDTPMVAALPQAARESLAQQVPFPPRLGRPEEFALLAEQIILNPMLNGEVIRLDGAMRMGAK
jgi:NAD(P)-dependent dehydrogenase (short-subunit alcohol dehydrogenase family)